MVILKIEARKRGRKYATDIRCTLRNKLNADLFAHFFAQFKTKALKRHSISVHATQYQSLFWK
jgi:hypothetical protein